MEVIVRCVCTGSNELVSLDNDVLAAVEANGKVSVSLLSIWQTKIV